MKRQRRKGKIKNREIGKIKKRVIQVLEQHGERAISMKRLLKLVGEKDTDGGVIHSVIAELIREERVNLTRKKRISIASPSVMFRGKLQMHASGYAFVTVDGLDRDIYIARSRIGDAFHNDIVEVRIGKNKMGQRISGEVTEVVEKGMRKVVGRYFRGKLGPILKVEDKKFSFAFNIFAAGIKGIREGDVLEGVIEGRSERRGSRGVRVIRKIGKRLDVESITLSTIYLYGMEREFGKKSLGEVSSFPYYVRRHTKGRVDLTGLPFVTIDGASARDFDDAICLVKEGQKYRLLVSIADVSEYVLRDTSLDREAMNRGTSVYFPNRVVPMLPERLSADLCSLKENVNRMTLTVDTMITPAGEVDDVKLYPSVIKSRRRLTYDSVQQFLDGEGSIRFNRKLADMLTLMSELASILCEKRVREGSLDFDLPEPDIGISFEGELERVMKGERLFSHRIIEEFMLLANVMVAEYLDGLNFQFLFRIHEKPDPLKLKGFLKFSANFDRDLLKLRTVQNDFLQKVLKSIKDKPYEKTLNLVLLRSFKLAKYSPVNVGHFGLGFEKYTHFTSPIRRYPDLMVHRVLKHALGSHGFEKYDDSISMDIDKIGDHLSKKERYAEQAERDVIDKLKALYMVDHIGEKYTGFITSVHPFGFFIELQDIFVEGLVHISDLPADNYFMDVEGFTLRGKFYGQAYSVGDTVTIKVKDCDPMRGRIDFLLVEKDLQKK